LLKVGISTVVLDSNFVLLLLAPNTRYFGGLVICEFFLFFLTIFVESGPAVHCKHNQKNSK